MKNGGDDFSQTHDEENESSNILYFLSRSDNRLITFTTPIASKTKTILETNASAKFCQCRNIMPNQNCLWEVHQRE